MKPMLSATLDDPLHLTFPVMVSPKLDGLRCLMNMGAALSRNLKPFRNKFVQETLFDLRTGLDGELIVGEPNVGNVLGRTQSGIMSTDGEPDFTYWVFDDFSRPMEPFHVRNTLLLNETHSRVRVVPHMLCRSYEDFIEYERQFVDDGYEGIMIRGTHGRYKHGRATHNEQLLWKFKRFTDAEALVLDLEEGVTNNNEAKLDALGHTKRSHHQDNMVGAGRVGTIIARDLKTKEMLRISPGQMTMEQKIDFWNHKEKLVGHVITYKTFRYGMVDLPRFSTFKAFYV